MHSVLDTLAAQFRQTGIAPAVSLGRAHALGFLERYTSLAITWKDIETTHIPGIRSFGVASSTDFVFKIEHARQVVSALSLFGANGHSQAEERTIFLLIGTETITTEAANALLKTLEEGAYGVWIMLINDRPEAFLPTIRSRCIIVTPNEFFDAEVNSKPQTESLLVQLARQAVESGSPIGLYSALATTKDLSQDEAQAILRVLAVSLERSSLAIANTPETYETIAKAMNTLQSTNANPRTVIDSVVMSLFWGI